MLHNLTAWNALHLAENNNNALICFFSLTHVKIWHKSWKQRRDIRSSTHTWKAKHQDRFIFFSANGIVLITCATPKCLKKSLTSIQGFYRN